MGRPRKTDPLTGSREQLERYLWEATEWRGDAGLIDRIMAAIDQYVVIRTGLLTAEPAPEFVFDDSKKIGVQTFESEQSAGDLSADDWAAVVSEAMEPEPVADVPDPEPVAVPGSLEEFVFHMVDVVLMENGKVCTGTRGCGTLKPFERFSRDAKAKDGRRNVCKDCDTKRKREWKAVQRAAGTYGTGRRRGAGMSVPELLMDAAVRAHESPDDRAVEHDGPAF
jgi:hypothetical protein